MTLAIPSSARRRGGADGFALIAGRLVARPAAIPLAVDVEVPDKDQAVANSGRGQYFWLNVPARPPGWPLIDTYWRDQLNWQRDLEKSPGVYTFDALEAGLQEAEAMGGRLHFRIMAAGGTETSVHFTPAWVTRQQPDGYPDWNSESFLSAWEALFAAMGAVYDSDPRVGILDLGGYGSWGEWYIQPELGATPITRASAERLMTAVIDSFPSKYVLVNWLDDWPDIACPLSPRMGIRNDAVGGFPQGYASDIPAVQNAWMTAPMVGEWSRSGDATSQMGLDTVNSFHMSLLSSGNYPRLYSEMDSIEQAAWRRANLVAGFRYGVTSVSLPRDTQAEQVASLQLTWENTGTAGTYDDWQVVISFVGLEGQARFDSTLAGDLKALRGGAQTWTEDVAIPGDAEGRYQVRLFVLDPQAYLEPMRLAMTGRAADGSYLLGTLTI